MNLRLDFSDKLLQNWLLVLCFVTITLSANSQTSFNPVPAKGLVSKPLGEDSTKFTFFGSFCGDCVDLGTVDSLILKINDSTGKTIYRSFSIDQVKHGRFNFHFAIQKSLLSKSFTFKVALKYKNGNQSEFFASINRIPPDCSYVFELLFKEVGFLFMVRDSNYSSTSKV